MRIGLIAMSGIRAHDPELVRLGLTLPGFVERSKVIASLPSLGLLTLAGMTPRHHRLEYIEVRDIREAEIDPSRFDLVGISSYTAQIFEAYGLADRFRSAGIEVVLGGPHVSMLPDEAKEHCSAVVVGHGELHWTDVLCDAEKGALKSVYGSRDDVYDLADAPMPAFELLDVDRYNRLTVQTSRGCPLRCEFCAGSLIFQSRYRQKPAAKVLAEIDRIRTLWREPFIEFADDNTFVNRDYWIDLLPEIAKRGIRWFTETDVSVGEDDEMLDMIREAGCAELLIGLETPVAVEGNDPGLRWKMKRLPRYREALRNIQQHGIRVNGCFVLGLDGHTVDVFDELLEFVHDVDLFDVQITVQTPFPGTPLYARLAAEDRLLDRTGWDRCTLFDVNFRPSGMTVGELEEGFRRVGLKLYSDEWTRSRRRRFFTTLKSRRESRRRST